MRAIDFQAAEVKVRESDARYGEGYVDGDKKKPGRMRAIIDRDNDDKRARGGTEEGALGGKAQAAARKVMRQRDDARAAIAGPVLRAADEAHAQLVRKTLTSAQAFLADRAALAALEHNRNRFADVAGQPKRKAIAGDSADATAFVNRADAMLNPPADVRPAVRPTLPEPDFADLVAS